MLQTVLMKRQWLSLREAKKSAFCTNHDADSLSTLMGWE
jgi:hypothetical protein